MKAAQIVDRLLAESLRGENQSDLSLDDLTSAYAADYTDDPGFVDHFYLNQHGDQAVYRVLGRDELLDDGPWYVTDVYVKATDKGLTMDFAGQVLAAGETEESVRPTFK